MSIAFHCLECLQTYEVDDELAGKMIRCRDCYTIGKVEAPATKADKKTQPKRSLDSDRPQMAAVEAASQGKADTSETRLPLIIRYRCPFCHSQRYPRRPILLGIMAMAMLTLGVLAAVYFWFVFAIAVSTANGRVVNDGLMNDRVVGMIGAVGLCLGGTLIRVTAAHRRFCPDCRIRVD